MTQKYINSFMVDNKSPKTTMYNHFNPNTQTISSPKKNEQAHYNILGMYPNLILQPNFCQNILLLGAVFVFHDESSENQQAAAMADLPLPSQSQVLLYFLQSSFSLHLLLSSLSSSLMTELDLDLHPTSTNGGSIFNMPCRIRIPHPCRHGYFAKNGESVQHRSLRIYDFVVFVFPLKVNKQTLLILDNQGMA